MMRDVMESAGLTIWPILSLVLFFSFFVLLFFWIYRKGSHQHYNNMGMVALDNDSSKGNKA